MADHERNTRTGTKKSLPELECALGFRWLNGLGIRRNLPPCVELLLNDFKLLCEEFIDVADKQIGESPTVQAKFRACFDKLGPALWPDLDRAAWLVDATSETSEAWSEYTRDLYFSKASDREMYV
jgi:hypothetical protein